MKKKSVPPWAYNKGFVTLPIAIVVAGTVIALAIVYTNITPPTNQLADPKVALDETSSAPVGSTTVRPIDKTDHIRGNPQAPITIVEYSDFECPFCARIHPTLTRILEEYPDDVRWVYRHFPLSQIHSRATKAAVASECAAELGGNEAFWHFAETIFNNQRNLGDALYTETARRIGIHTQTFSECLASDRHEQAVEDDLEDAIASGGRGTPYSVVIGPDGTATPLSGALPYQQFAQLIENML